MHVIDEALNNKMNLFIGHAPPGALLINLVELIKSSISEVQLFCSVF